MREPAVKGVNIAYIDAANLDKAMRELGWKLDYKRFRTWLKDKYKVLVNASEGKTKSLRQWRFTSEEEINEKRILEYIREAIAIEERGLKIKPAKFKPLPVPEILVSCFKEDKNLKIAFEQLTPGRQKEYIIYLNEPKQEATKSKRLEKIKPMILRGVGLNDKYK